MKVIKANHNHTDMVSSLFNDYRIFYEQISDLAGAKYFIQERLQKQDSIIFLVTDSEEKTAYGFAQLYPSFSSISMSPIYILNDLFVIPKMRQRGVAKLLLEKSKIFSTENHAKKIVLETAVSNKTAQQLYESVGYQQKKSSFLTYILELPSSTSHQQTTRTTK